MEQQTQNLPAVIDHTSLAENIKNTFPVIEDKVKRALLATSQITEISTDEQDKTASDLLVKVRVTIEGKKDENGNKLPGIRDIRQGITSKLDELKAELIAPENKLVAEGKRIKALRDSYANKKYQEQQEQLKKAEEEKKRQNEIADLKAAIKKQLEEVVFNTVNSLTKTISDHVSSMNLDNWDEMERKFNATPKLKVDLYDQCFNIRATQTILEQSVIDAVVNEVRASESYEKYNSLYIQHATPMIEGWKKELPAKKSELERIKELEATNAIAAASEKRKLAEQDAEKKRQQEELIKKQQQEAKERADQEHNEAKLSNEFDSQVVVQQQQEQKNIRKERVAVITCEPHQIVKTWSKVLFACYSSPKFKGHSKRDKEGNLVLENGIPQYEPWAQKLLDFIAKNFDGEIEGVEFKESITTIAKS